MAVFTRRIGGFPSTRLATITRHVDPLCCPVGSMGLHLCFLLQGRTLTEELELFPAGESGWTATLSACAFPSQLSACTCTSAGQEL